MNQLPLSAATMGARAHQLLQRSPPASINGSTSRGVFLRLDQTGIVFLSTEPHRGPLTINLLGDASAFLALDRGEPALLDEQAIAFPAHQISVNLRDAHLWRAPEASGGRLPPETLRRSVESVARQIYAARGDAGRLDTPLTALLILLDATSSSAGEAAFLPVLERLQWGLSASQPQAVGEALVNCLGRGPGLTPSGDDLVMGFVLALHRWGHGLFDQQASFMDNLIQAAFLQTTMLSANLIECAAGGQADERLIFALDGIVTGAVETRACASALLEWGSSSGGDALAGMGVALMAAASG